MAVTLLTRKVTVLIGRFGTDEVDIALDMPSPFPEMGYQGHATIQVRKGYGIQWCKEVLGVADPEIIDVLGVG